MGKIHCANWDSDKPEKMTYEDGSPAGILMPSARPEALQGGIQSWSKPDAPERKSGPHQYLTLVSMHDGGERAASIHLSRHHPDAGCECEDDEYDGHDVHDALRISVPDLKLVRVNGGDVLPDTSDYRGGDYGYDDAIVVDPDAQKVGVLPYEWGLAGPDGAWFVIHAYPDTPAEYIKRCKSALRDADDVVSCTVKRDLKR